MKRLIILFTAIFFITHGAFTQNVADPYKKVDQLLWIVSDLNKTILGWKKMGFSEVIRLDTLTGYSQKNSSSFKLVCAKANLGGAQITWIQPTDLNSVFANFHSVYGDGVMGIVHRMENMEAIDQEVARLANLEVNLLDKITLYTPEGDIDYVLIDSYQDGKYVLGFTSNEPDKSYFHRLLDKNLYDLKVSQYAFAIEDESEISNYWQSIDLPEITISSTVLSEKEYYKEKKDFEIDLGWQFHGNVPYEWVIPRKPPTIHMDHIQNHGEGFHHLGFDVKDLDQILKDFESLDIKEISGGKWGREGHPGSGVFKYFETDKLGGVVLELLWTNKEN